MRILIAFVLAVFALPSSAQTADGGENTTPSGIAQYDKNSDGYVSTAEAARDTELSKRFKSFDANRDGKLSEDEFLKAKQDQDKQFLADSTITTRVKTALLTAKGVPSFSISVDTYEGRVQLSGYVEHRDQIAQAGKVAAGVSGVRSVRNDLKVK